ncbi:hypothetical protein BN1723_019303, partial [Verticillium longisporum]
MPSSNMDDNMSVHSRPDADDDDDHNGPDHPRKRQRVRLSCLECRRRKLSCDRGYPCQRCLKSGTPDRCTYETKSGVVMNASAGVPPAFAQLDSRRHGLGLGHGHGHSHGHSHGHAGPDMSVASSGASDACVRDAAATKDHDRIRRLELEVAQLKGQLTHH